MVLPRSKFPTTLPRLEMVRTYNSVGISEPTISATEAKYFAKTIDCKEIGLVRNNSKVPIFFSSLKARIVTAGIKNKRTQGANWKKADRSANPASNMLKVPLKTHKNKPLKTKNNAITKYPIGLAKKECISRFISANIWVLGSGSWVFGSC